LIYVGHKIWIDWISFHIWRSQNRHIHTLSYCRHPNLGQHRSLHIWKEKRHSKETCNREIFDRKRHSKETFKRDMYQRNTRQETEYRHVTSGWRRSLHATHCNSLQHAATHSWVRDGSTDRDFGWRRSIYVWKETYKRDTLKKHVKETCIYAKKLHRCKEFVCIYGCLYFCTKAKTSIYARQLCVHIHMYIA